VSRKYGVLSTEYTRSVQRNLFPLSQLRIQPVERGSAIGRRSSDDWRRANRGLGNGIGVGIVSEFGLKLASLLRHPTHDRRQTGAVRAYVLGWHGGGGWVNLPDKNWHAARLSDVVGDYRAKQRMRADIVNRKRDYFAD